MEKLIGIVIPPAVKSEITGFASRYGITFDPYIDLIGSDIIKGARGVDRGLQSYCLSQPSFKTIIGGPNIETNESGQLFYLTVMMGGLNTVRAQLIKHLKLPSYEGVFRPNIAVVMRTINDHSYDFDAMMADAKQIFSKPRTISVEALAIYSRESKDVPYTLNVSYNFTGR